MGDVLAEVLCSCSFKELLFSWLHSLVAEQRSADLGVSDGKKCVCMCVIHGFTLQFLLKFNVKLSFRWFIMKILYKVQR